MIDQQQIEVLHVSPGYYCNLSCAHCSNDSGPTRAKGMLAEELAQVIKAVKLLRPKKLLFTGGEPTFHIDLINSIISAHPNLADVHVTITTNGWFARLPGRMGKLLSSFEKLDAVQLSYDKWHKPALSKEDVQRLAGHCVDIGLTFSVQAAYSTALDLIALSELQQGSNFPVTMQAVEAVGRAKANGISADTKTIDGSLLDRKCPNQGMLTFSPKLGFSACCSSLMFNGKGPLFASPTAEDHLDSAFFKEVSSKTLREQMLSRGISEDDLLGAPAVRSICSACEFIHCSKPKTTPLSVGA